MEKTNWYVMFVMVNHEGAVRSEFDKRFQKIGLKSFVPLREIIHKVDGKKKRIQEIMFPGYLFIETIMGEKEFLVTIQDFVATTYGAIRILAYGDGRVSLCDDDMHHIYYLIGDKRCMPVSTLIKEGSKITVLYGPLKGRESIIKKVNPHQHKAWIEVMMCGEIRVVSVGIETIKISRTEENGIYDEA